MLQYGSKKVIDMYYGGTKVRLMYQGSNKVFNQGDFLFGCGNNDYGQLGFSAPGKFPYFTKCPTGAEWKQVSCGHMYTAAIDANGFLYTTGRNNVGQLGLGDTQNRVSFNKVGSSNNWVKVVCSNDFMICLNSLGELWGAGSNSVYQLGLPSSGNYSTLTKLYTPSGSSGWLDFGVGNGFSVAINSDNQLYGTGVNDRGQLLSNDYLQEFTSLLSGCSKVFCGRKTVFVIGTDSNLYGFGSNSGYIMGVNTTQTVINHRTLLLDSSYGISEASSGYFHSIFRSNDNKIYVCGSNSKGQLAQPASTTEIRTPTQIGADILWDGCSAGYEASMLVSKNGKLFVTGTPYSLGVGGDTMPNIYELTEVEGLFNVSDVSLAQYHSMVISN